MGRRPSREGALDPTPLASPQQSMLAKPPTIPTGGGMKPKPMNAPPVATFTVKNNDYAGANKSDKRPDILM